MVGLKAVNCRSGDVLANEQATASGKEQVLKALGEATADLDIPILIAAKAEYAKLK